MSSWQAHATDMYARFSAQASPRRQKGFGARTRHPQQRRPSHSSRRRLSSRRGERRLGGMGDPRPVRNWTCAVVFARWRLFHGLRARASPDNGELCDSRLQRVCSEYQLRPVPLTPRPSMTSKGYGRPSQIRPSRQLDHHFGQLRGRRPRPGADASLARKTQTAARGRGAVFALDGPRRTGESLLTNARRDAVFGAREVRIAADWYLNGAEPQTPEASPLYALLDGLPPLFIEVGERESLLDDSTRLAARARPAASTPSSTFGRSFLMLGSWLAPSYPRADARWRGLQHFLLRTERTN